MRHEDAGQTESLDSMLNALFNAVIDVGRPKRCSRPNELDEGTYPGTSRNVDSKMCAGEKK